MNFYRSFLFLLVFISVVSCRQETKEVTSSQTTIDCEAYYQKKVIAATTQTNWLRPPFKYWAIKNVDQLFDVSPIPKGPKVAALDEDLISFDDVAIEQFDGTVYSFEEHLDSNRTDGFLILHKGKIAYEKYFGNMSESTTHNWFSMSKSLTGLTAAILAAEGKIDLSKSTLDYLPELKGSAWDGTTVEMVMNMLVGIDYNEQYDNPRSDAYKFAKVGGFVKVPGPPSEFESVYDYMKSVKKGRDHNEQFHYVSLNTEILGMIITKVTGMPPSEVMSKKIWAKIGAEQDAFIIRNTKGYELVSAAVNSNLRDAGRLGQLMLDDGFYNGEQIVPKSVIQRIKKGGSVEKFADSKRGKVFKNYSYAHQWWHTDQEAFFAKGLFGQWIYVDPATELVIVKLTTSDIPTSTEYDWINNTNLMNAIVKKISSL